jgi:hypothetical protein
MRPQCLLIGSLAPLLQVTVMLLIFYILIPPPGTLGSLMFEGANVF